MLRVIAGDLGGRRLAAPAGLHTRPTADRVREALFNILGPPGDGAVVLDLYAGSGALGIEALSRGAAAAIFVERDAAACRALRKNLLALSLNGRALLLEQEVPRALLWLAAHPEARQHRPCRWIFADPPYAAGLLPALLAQLGAAQNPLIGPETVVALEHARANPRQAKGDADCPASSGALRCADRRDYGQTSLSFFHPAPPTLCAGDSP